LNRAFGSWLPTSEAGAGAVPGEYSRLSFGLVVAGTFDGVERFTRIDPDAHSSYRGLKPISERFDPGALPAISRAESWPRPKASGSGSEPLWPAHE
jgi:hypothetical protein